MKAVTKNIFREIAKTKNRFLSLFTICAIGVGFFSGVRATGSDMKISADNFYDEHDLFDIRVMSTFGLTEGDISAISEVEGVTLAVGSKYVDLTLSNNGHDYNTRIYSYKEENPLNDIDLLSGNFPKAENECIINSNKLIEGLKIGDKVTLSDPTDREEFPLNLSEFTIVGTFDTPMYISATQRGSTTIGDGSLDMFLYITESNFTQEVYTEVYIQSEQLKNERSYSDKYEQIRENITNSLEDLGVPRSEIRYDEVLSEALHDIEEGEKELEKAKTEGQQELDDAKKELDEAAVKISDGEKELLEAKTELEDGEAKLAEGFSTLADAKAEIDSGWAEIYKNQADIDEAEKTLADSRKQLSEAKKQLDEGRKTLDESKKQLDEGQAELNSNKKTVEDGKIQLEQGRQQLTAAQTEYQSGLEVYNKNKAEYDNAATQYEQGAAQLAAAEALLGSENPQIIQQKAVLEQTKKLLDESKIQLDGAFSQLEAARLQIEENSQLLTQKEQELTTAEQQITEAQKQLDEGFKQYESGLEDYNNGLSDYLAGVRQYNEGYNEFSEGLVQLNDARNKLISAEKDYEKGLNELNQKQQEFLDGKADYEQGVKDLEDAKKKYSEGMTEYLDGVETFNREIAEAEEKIADGKQQIADAGEAKWYIFNRDDNPGYSEYKSNSERIDKIAVIFPIFFLLVAALVCLTTMSRMVEEQRMQIGTLKSLGYSDGIILRNYIIYAVAAAATGSIIGAFIGMYLFPFVIMFAYGIMYNIKDYYFELSPVNILLSAGSMVAAIALTVYLCVRKALKEAPAELMRPKAPKSGKRVLLERIGFIWNRLSFFGKVSGRNLFRYKRRMFMTVVGIAGCTALSLTGFGLKDSIGDIVDIQYNSLYLYSGFIAVEDNLTENELQTVYDELMDYNSETEYTRAFIKQYTLSSDSGNVQCYVTAIEDTDIFENMVDLHERKSGDKITFANAGEGVIVTEKLTKLLGVSKGDEISLKISENNIKPVTIGAITEHYTSHYMYISGEKYSELFGEQPKYNVIYFENGISEDKEIQAKFSERMLKTDGVLSVSLKAGSSESFNNMMKIMDLVVIVLIVSAGALAFVVLYNLTNVNITERIREIATLKVLGFYDNEVSRYVFRENILLSVMGAGVGLLLGTALCQFVIQTAEIDEVMFGRNIHPLSFILAFAVTVLFSLIVNRIMRREVKKISMVESLKSVE